MKFALKWFAIAVWLDMADRLIGSPLDFLFSHWHLTQWLDGFTQCVNGGLQ